MGGGAFQNRPTHGFAAGEENVIEFLLQQATVFRPAAGDDSHVFGRKNGTDQLFQQGAGGGGVGAGLDDRCIAGCQRVRQRVQRQQQGIIPGAHDQGYAIGAGLAVAMGGKLGKRRGNGFFSGVVTDMPQQIADFADNQPGFAHIALFGGFPQIRPDGLRDGIFMIGQRLPQLFQCGNPVFDRQRGAGGKIGALLFHNSGDFLRGHLDSSITS